MAAWCGYGGGRGPHQVDSHHVSSEGLHQAVSKPGAERLLRGFVMVICEFLKLGLPSVLGPQHKLWLEGVGVRGNCPSLSQLTYGTSTTGGSADRL